MELKDFIRNAISSITHGIVEAQDELGDVGAIVNPEKLETGKDGNKLLRSDGWRYVQELEFEINVAVDDKTKKGGGASLQVLRIVNIGVEGDTEATVSNSNRLKFKIPVAFPTTKTPGDYKPKNKLLAQSKREIA